MRYREVKTHFHQILTIPFWFGLILKIKLKQVMGYKSEDIF